MSPALEWVFLIVVASPKEHICKKLFTTKIGKLQVLPGLYQNQTVHWLHTAFLCDFEYIINSAKVLALLNQAVSIGFEVEEILEVTFDRFDRFYQ